MDQSSPPVDGDRQQPDDRYLPGEIIDAKYRLVRPLARGGAGRVWLAHNLVLDVPVGLKLIYSNTEPSNARSGRPLQEARAAARLGHPAIVRIFDFGETRHRDPFVAMEMLNGETLADTLARERRMPAIRAIQMLLPIADALSVAHGKGIVHRDVKPENIFISRDEVGRVQPKLLDFGIARVGSSPKLTLQGTVLGTPDYMSPEQARGDSDVDERTDIWSFCVVLYELVSGEPPFKGENYNALLYAIINDEPKPLTDFAAGDAELWTLLQNALHKAPKRRWESMHMLGEALALWLYERGVREDACAASLKANWLESGLSDVKIDVAPSRPAASPRRPGPSSGLDTQTLEPVGEAPAPAARKRRPAVIAAVIIVALTLAVVLFSLSREQRASPPIEALPAQVATPAVAREPTSAVVVPLTTATAPQTVATDAGPKRAPRARKPKAQPSALPQRSKDFDVGF